MYTKQLRGVEVKDAEQGLVSAVFSTFDVIDKDGDVTLPGAFTDGAPVRISAYQHTSWQGALPVGKGVIRATETEAILDGQFFMDMPEARSTFASIKGLGDLQEWSYGFDIVDSDHGERDGTSVRLLKQLAVHEVSPVLIGAGENTRTLAVKAAAGTNAKGAAVVYKAAIRPHETDVVNKAWDSAAAAAGFPEIASVSALRSMHAWVEPGSDPEAKASYRFCHHDTADGPANIHACLAGIAVLNGARGGAGIPEADRKGVYNHLAAHLRDADREPPELKDADGGTLKLYDELVGTMAVVSETLASVDRVVALRAEKGKTLSHSNVEVLEWIDEDLRKLRTFIETPQEQLAREHVRLVKSLTRE